MATLTTKEQILARVRQILVESFELEPDDVRPDAHLIDDLDLDSIDAIDLAVSLEEETGLDVSEDELREIRLVQDVVELIHGRLQSA
jgi:acyl carrier protein